MALSSTLKVAAQPYKGVGVGDYFTYGKFSSWVDPTTAPKFQEWKLFENMSLANFTIVTNPLPTSQDEIIFSQKLVFSNATPSRTISGGVDLLTGVGQGYLFFVYAGLNKGERIYPQSQNYTYTVNATRKDPYWGGRDTFILNQTAVWGNQSMVFVQSTIVQWDKLTGAALRIVGETDGIAEGGNFIMRGGMGVELIATNRFPIEHPAGFGEMLPFYIVIAIILVVALIVVIVRASSGASTKKKWKRLKE